MDDYSYEIKDFDAGGRIGQMKLGEKILDTPNLFPVVSPFQNVILPRRLFEEFGAQCLFTNAYIIYKNRERNPEIQEKVFKALGINEEEAKNKFGFLIEALKYGAPPHGGIAYGLDRLIAILTGNESIREVIAFPKNKAAQSLVDGAPSAVDEKQLKELGLKLDLPKK